MQDEQQRREFGATVRQPTLPSYMYQVPVRQMQDEEQLRKLGATPRRNERSQTDSSGSESSGSESEDEELHAFGGKKRPQREKVDSSPGPSQNLNLSGNSPRLSGYGGGSGSQAPQGNGGGSAGSGSGSGAGAGGSGGASGSGSGNNPGSNMDGTGGYSYRRIQAAGAPPPPPPSGSYGGYNMSSYLPQPQQNTMYGNDRNVTSGTATEEAKQQERHHRRPAVLETTIRLLTFLNCSNNQHPAIRLFRGRGMHIQYTKTKTRTAYCVH